MKLQEMRTKNINDLRQYAVQFDKLSSLSVENLGKWMDLEKDLLDRMTPPVEAIREFVEEMDMIYVSEVDKYTRMALIWSAYEKVRPHLGLGKAGEG